MITKTVGVGGDYADIGLAWQSLPATLSDDYTFNVISDFTEATGIRGNPDVRILDGFSVTFQDTGNHKITSAGKVYYITADTSIAPNSSTINVIGLDITLTGYIFTYSEAGLIDIAGYDGGDIITVNLQNLKLKGFNKTVGTNCGIMLHTYSQIDRVINCTITNFGTGMYCGYSAVTNGANHIIENCSIYDCGRGVYMLIGPTALRYYTFKNTVVCSCGANYYNNNTPPDIVNNIFINCADSGTTITTFGATQTDSLTNIIPANEFKSLVSTSSDFLAISTTSSLYAAGIATGLLPDNTESIEGYPRPNDFGAVSIGAHEPNVEIDFTATPLDPAIHDTVSFTSIINEATIPAYSWNLDEGNTDSAANPTERYTVPGLKTISLTVTDDGGRMATVTKPNYLDVHDYGLGFVAVPEKGRVPLKVQFTPSFEVLP